MGIKNLVSKAGSKAADKIAKLSVLSPEQLAEVQKNREAYLAEMPSVNDELAVEQTSRLIAACSVEVGNEYLNHIKDYYVPIQNEIEYESSFRTANNIRYFEITKWVTNKNENSLEKLVNVYEVLSNQACNIALIFNRTCEKTNVFLAVTNTNNADDNVDVSNFSQRIREALKGNFPGSDFSSKTGSGILPCLNNNYPYSVACTSNIPGEKSEKFISQTIEKLLDGIVPDSREKEYTIILLATPISDLENRKIHLAELYSGLSPYSAWETNYTFTQTDSANSNATFGVNVGASAGIQQGQNQSVAQSNGITENSSRTETDSTNHGESTTNGKTETNAEGETTSSSDAESKGSSHTDTSSTAQGHTNATNTSESHTDSINEKGNIFKDLKSKFVGGETGSGTSDMSGSGTSVSDSVTDTTSFADTMSNNNTHTESLAKNITKSFANSTSKTISSTVGKSIANTLGKAVSNTVTHTSGIYKGVNLGANVGANFARSSNVTATVGKNEGIVQHFTNYNIKHLLENLELQMNRLEQSTALGMWDFAAYVLSADQNVANNVAYSYLSLTQGEKSYISHTAVNLWRGDTENSDDAKEICAYLKTLRHPIFALNPVLSQQVPISNIYPAVITPTTSLSGKELAYSLNFPSKSIAGLPVINCAEFGRDVISYKDNKSEDDLILGNIYHMNHVEPMKVELSLNSLSSHVFITGSTGSGKSNTVYKIIEEASNQEVNFMVIEPAKGEYKNVFGSDSDVSVYGTNPELTQLLKINPFSFQKGIHIYEHMDRLVEIFNVCWPMYAAMPAVLKNAIELSYKDCGWDLVKSQNKYNEAFYPTFADVARNIKSIIDSSEYDNENKGAYKGSLLTRLQSLSNGINGLVFSNDEICCEDLFDKNVIIDLSRVGSTETKSLIMGMLILKLQEYRYSNAKSGNVPLKHITVLEEAHNILKRTSTEQNMESSNLAGKSVEMISNAIAEMRTFGEGFVIVDQSPGLMDMSVIRNTNTKIIMRLPDKGDRELVGKAANLNDEQITELSKLPCGVGAIYQNEWIQPVLCMVDKASSVEKTYVYECLNEKNTYDLFDEKLRVAEILSKCLVIDSEIDRNTLIQTLKNLKLSDYIIVSVLNMLSIQSSEPNMKKIAPIMHALFPELTETIKTAFQDEKDITLWTEEANNILLSYHIEDQVRRDIIQGVITHYLLNETNNRSYLEDWIQRGGLR